MFENRAIFDAIEKRNSTTVFYLTAVFFPLAIGSVLLGVAQVFTRMGIQRRWRAWLNNHLLALAHAWTLLPAQSCTWRPPNPEYRIADDVRVATESPVDFISGITQALLSAATFIAVLWTIGGPLMSN